MTDEPEVPAEEQAQPVAIDEPNVAAADQFDAMTDDDLRAFIKDRDGRFPHPATLRPKLLIAARGDIATSKEIEATQEAAPVAGADDAASDIPEAAADAAVAPVVDEPLAEVLDPEGAPEAGEAVGQASPAKHAALENLELRIAEIAHFLKAELHHFEDGVDGVVKLVSDRLKAAF